MRTAKSHLSRLLNEVAAGEEVVICRASHDDPFDRTPGDAGDRRGSRAESRATCGSRGLMRAPVMGAMKGWLAAGSAPELGWPHGHA